MRMMFFLLPILLFAEVNNQFFNTAHRGWFFGETNETNETNKTKPQKINPFDVKKMMKLPDKEFMASIPLDNLDLYSAQDFKKVFQRARGIAVMKPTRQNVYIVKRMQKFMTDQADKFARVWYLETIQNPELEYPGIQSSTFARTTQFYEKQKTQKAFFKKHSEDIGFVVFYNPADKMSNVRQRWIYNSFKKEYPNYDIVWIDVTKRPDLVKKFNIKTLPDNFYVYKNKKGEGIWVRIKAGLVSETELKDNVIFTFKNIISKKDK